MSKLFFIMLTLLSLSFFSVCAHHMPFVKGISGSIEGASYISDELSTGMASEDPDTFTREYSWEYDRRNWKIYMDLSDETYAFYRQRDHKRDYDLFVSDSYDDEMIDDLAGYIERMGILYGLHESKIPYLVASFVQSLPYTSDNETTGYDEYPRYPYETLYENGGDCEDKSILAASILQQLGYSVLLVRYSDHMGVAVSCNDFPDRYYEYSGERYCYLETTGGNWKMGQIPDRIKEEEAQLIPLFKKPSLDIAFDAGYDLDPAGMEVDMTLDLTNLGSRPAEDVRLYVALQKEDTRKVWDSMMYDPVSIGTDQQLSFRADGLSVPRGERFRIYAVAYGRDIVSDEEYSNWIG